MSAPRPNPAPPKRLHIRTYGCQMNAYDSERMAESLAPLGFVSVPRPEDADLVLVNTCHIREKATEKLYSELGRLRQIRAAKRQNGDGDMRIGVAGCVAQAEGEELLARTPGVDLLVGPQEYHRLPAMMRRLLQGETREPLTALNFPTQEKFRAWPPRPTRPQETRASAFLSIQEGCDKFCAFCVVPYTRGKEFSRPAAHIEAEARRLIASGVKDITLLGQNVNAWHGEGVDGKTWRLGRLLNHLAGLDGVERLRYATSHPRDMDAELMDAHRDNDKLMPYLHLPIQSGSDTILKAMNRGHTAADYLRLVERVRAVRPDIAMSSDFIVGFPGESETDFQATLDLIGAVGFARAYSFAYSPRPGTPAADAKSQVPEEEKRRRLARLQELLREQQLAFNHAQEGKRVQVLFERRGRFPGQLVGRSPWNQAVHADADDSWLGRAATVAVRKAHENSLEGVLDNPPSEARPT